MVIHWAPAWADQVQVLDVVTVTVPEPPCAPAEMVEVDSV